MASVSKHLSLWKPGAASPKPRNKVPCGAGWKALSVASEAASKRDGVKYLILQAGGLDMQSWLGLQRGGRRQREQD